MIILTAGHTGAHTGAQCAETHFDEGAENIWLRNRIAEILTNKYGLAVLLDNDTASLQLLIQSINALPCRDARLERPPTFDLQPSTVNTQNIKTCLLGRDFAQQKQDHYVKEKSSYVFLSKNTTSEASSVRNTNSVRISSTRGINISRHETDTSTRIRLTLRPDTVFIPYTNHIRSDTIVVPDPTTQAKLTTARWQIAMLLLIIIVATIIFILKDKKT